MNVVRNLFNRNSRKDDIHFTEVTLLSPCAFSDEKIDIQCEQNTTVTPSCDKRIFCECRVSPMKDMVDRQPMYTKEDLKRIADMFLVSYTHCTTEGDEAKKKTKKTVKRGQKLFTQILKIIS